MFCDISKAFDRVWHKGLIFKLKQYGLSENILKWISSYLQYRKQRVFVNSEFSNEKHINAGVPQGSVLGPLLFLVYVNDIADSLHSVTRLFADDSSLAVTSNDNEYIQATLNHDLDIISKWATQWLVQFNPSKTEVLYLSLMKNNARPSIVFQNTQLNFVVNHKHLGVTLSEDGSWHTHITNIANSAAKVLGTMRMLKFKLRRRSLNQIYVSYLSPIMEYASIVWENCTQYEKDLLDKIQYDAARIVTGLTRSVSINKLLNEIGWVSLKDRRQMQKLILMFKYSKGELPDYLNSHFPDLVINTNNYFLRNQMNYASIVRRLVIYSNSTIPSSVRMWNELDIDIRNSDTLSTFKNKLKHIYKPADVPSFLLSGYRFYQVHHARIRNNCSNLNADLFTNHLRESPECACGYANEDAEHYFFRCSNFTNQRHQLFVMTRGFHPLSPHKLLYGINTFGDEENKILFTHVQSYIKATKRFEPAS